MDFDDDDHSGPFHPTHRYDLNSRIMLTAIVSLTFVVILVVILHIYVRCVLRRRAHRQAAAIRSLSITVDHARSGEPPKTGLDPTLIASLPTYAFKKIDFQDDATSTECAVCLSGLEEGEMVRLLPNCKHDFHVECIDKWLLSHSTCPICRTEAEPRLQPEPREGPSSGATEPPSAPPLEGMEGNLSSSSTSNNNIGSGGCQELSSGKVNGSSSSRLSSFRRMLTRERSSSRRHQSSGQEVDRVEDLERQ